MSETRILSGKLLREVARLHSRAKRVVADCCRTISTQCHLLTELSRSGPLPLSELGTRGLLEKRWVSRAVDAMVERGLVTKVPNPSGARIWLVTLTDNGVRHRPGTQGNAPLACRAAAEAPV